MLEYSFEEISSMRVEVPSKIPRNFKNYEGKTVGNFEVLWYVGKVRDRHSWAVKCICGKVVVRDSSRLMNTESCGCVARRKSSERMRINNPGAREVKTDETIRKLQEEVPKYSVIDHRDGKVMSKWDFYCNECSTYFTSRPDNILKRKSGGSKRPCACNKITGFDPNQPAWFYILHDNDYCKYGISKDYARRKVALERSSGRKFQIAFLGIFDEGGKIATLERKVKNAFNFPTNVEKCDGYTEYLDIVHLNDLERFCVREYQNLMGDKNVKQ